MEDYNLKNEKDYNLKRDNTPLQNEPNSNRNLDSFVKSLDEILLKIDSDLENSPILLKDTLKKEIEKMYTFNAFGICYEKLNNGDLKKYKEGIERTKKYFSKLSESS